MEWSGWRTSGLTSRGPWMFAFGTSHWGIDIARQGPKYVIQSDLAGHAVLAGPFDTIEAAKAAYLMIGELQHHDNNP